MTPGDARELAVWLAVNRLTVFGYIGACGYPHYMLDPCSVEVWVPARHYLVAREVFETIRCCGERIVIRMDEL
jgi:hypothetical protein